MREQSYSLSIMRAAKWDFAKAKEIKKMQKHYNEEEFDVLLDSMVISNELAMGIVDEKKLTNFEKAINHLKKNRKQYAVLTCMTLFVITSGALSFAMPTATMAGAKVVSVSTIASTTPSFSLANATAMINKLISNLIKLGVLATVASCVFEMLKSIVEGNINRLPKTLVSHAMMCCSVLLAPTVFNYISGVFNMGTVLSMATNILL